MREHRNGNTKGGQLIGDFELIYTEKFNVTIDWLLKGEQSSIPRNDGEKEYLSKFRKAEELMIIDKIESYCNYLTEKSKAKI